MNETLEPVEGADGDGLRDDVMHGLLVAMADRESIAQPIAFSTSTPARMPRRFPLAALLSAALVLALVAVVVLPLLTSREANAAAILHDAQVRFASGGPRSYEIRITRWGGPFAGRFLHGEIEFRPGTPPVSEGHLELGDTGRRIAFGRDAEGAWIAGADGVRRARPFASDDDALSAQDFEALTLDAVLNRLTNGYDLEASGSPGMRVVIARRRPDVRVGPSRVELAMAQDGQTIERATIELDRVRHSTSIELRLRDADTH